MAQKKKFKLYITDYFRRNIKLDPKLLGKDIEVKLLQQPDEKKLFPEIEDADALIVDKTLITAYTLEKLTKCKIIARFGIGYDNVDIKSAGKNGIYVCNCPDFCHEEVADHAVGLMLSMTRNIVGYNNGLLKGDKSKWRPFGLASTKRLRDKTIGLIGLGRIGKEVAKRLQGFRVKVLFYDPNVSAITGNDYGAIKANSVEELASKSDIVSFHLPLNPETKVMANDNFFSNLKKGAYLINTSRGGILDTKALLRAMKKGIVEKAALDVLEEEPINFDEPLIKKWLADEKLQSHLILTPHVAFYSPESTEEIQGKILKNIHLAFAGKQPINCVNLDHYRKNKDK
ncbi:MAG: 2-hydroxyacid dehydrogenase [Candidatus Diapherotrites archaeon CG11_big_fil_rev_8_21_14_0_20_37_9]|nr:MAG: 2-hydroxyacid dehydrogenase [Candidatus Diapherotrites archaeon CG11_big_fil_rev_8_21_14_0_20_37_9]